MIFAGSTGSFVAGWLAEVLPCSGKAVRCCCLTNSNKQTAKMPTRGIQIRFLMVLLSRGFVDNKVAWFESAMSTVRYGQQEMHC